MKNYFPFLILFSIILIGGISSCKKNTIKPTLENLGYTTSITKGNYLLSKYHYNYSTWSGNYIGDTISNLNFEIARINNSRISFLNNNLKKSASDSTRLLFKPDSSNTKHTIYLEFFIANDSIYYFESENFDSYTETTIYSGRKL